MRTCYEVITLVYLILKLQFFLNFGCSVCGSNKKKKPLDEATLEVLASQVEKDDKFGICTSVAISDKYVLTAAHCIELAV